MSLLEARDIQKRYKDRRVLNGASLSVEPGELVSIVGASGSGKSTLARILCGTVRPDGGEALFDGEPLLPNGRFQPALRRFVQLIPQQPYASLDPRQRVGDAIAEPLLCHGLAHGRRDARAQARRLMERARLDPALFDRRPGELSGGQAQRVLIARSLGVRPRLLIADEATSMLDVTAQAQIARLLRDLVERDGVSVLHISHDRPLVDAISDRVYEMRDGKLAEVPAPAGRGETFAITTRNHTEGGDKE